MDSQLIVRISAPARLSGIQQNRHTGTPTSEVSSRCSAPCFKKLQRSISKITEQAANVYLMDPPEFVAMQKNVSGYRFYPALYILDLASLYKIQG